MFSCQFKARLPKQQDESLEECSYTDRKTHIILVDQSPFSQEVPERSYGLLQGY